MPLELTVRSMPVSTRLAFARVLAVANTLYVPSGIWLKFAVVSSAVVTVSVISVEPFLRVTVIPLFAHALPSFTISTVAVFAVHCA